MRVFLFLLCLASLNATANTTIITRVYDLDFGSKPEDVTLIFFTNGRLAKIPPMEKFLLDQLLEAKNKKQWLQISLDEKRVITDLVVTDPPEKEVKISSFSPSHKSLNQAYMPSTLPNMEVVEKLFKEARYYDKDSQCFNRAMVWSYEWWKKHSVKSNKTLIFFSRNYIRNWGEEEFEWWFHIAPSVFVMHEGQVVERVMDKKYTDKPRTTKEWTDKFMNRQADNVACPLITKYSEYADNPYSGECFVMKTNMYTWQPSDLQLHEAWGYTKTQFKIDEVKAAYLEAFDEQY